MPRPPPSELMKNHPEQAVEALIIRNNLLMRAKWDCFGFTLEQDGGEWRNRLFSMYGNSSIEGPVMGASETGAERGRERG